MSESKHGGPLLINLLLCSDTWFLSLPRVITNHGQEKLNSDVFIYQSDVERVLPSLKEPTALNSRLKDSVLFQDAINTLDLPQCYFDIYIVFITDSQCVSVLNYKLIISCDHSLKLLQVVLLVFYNINMF